MREASVQLFEEYRQKYDGSVDRALAETIQAIALLGLSRTDFFSHAAFYGGTALRLLYNLDRFSEDLDFSLLQPFKEFRLSSYLGSLRDEMEAFGFSVKVGERQKKIETPIESAFIKANTRIHVIQAGVPKAIADRIHRNAVCKVKLEIDIDPPPYADFNVTILTIPSPFPSGRIPDLPFWREKWTRSCPGAGRTELRAETGMISPFLCEKKSHFCCRILKRG